MYCQVGASESVLYTEVSFIQSVLYQRYTVRPLNNEHIGMDHREVVLFLKNVVYI